MGIALCQRAILCAERARAAQHPHRSMHVQGGTTEVHAGAGADALLGDGGWHKARPKPLAAPHRLPGRWC